MSEETEELELPEYWLWPRYFMHIAYVGTQYHGWQRQLNSHSIQAELEAALCKLLRKEKVITVGCGRTDAGVHARNFYLHFNVEGGIENTDDIHFKLNHMLPRDIAVYGIFRVADKAHARFDATERSYEYHIHQKRDPFVHHFSTYYPWPVDIDKMNEAASLLLTTKDFASFCKSGGGQKTTICDLRRAHWTQDGSKLVFYITADRFLRNMVRAVVGTLIKVGRDRMSLEEFRQVIESKTRVMAGDSMNAQGLHLTEIKYPYILGNEQ